MDRLQDRVALVLGGLVTLLGLWALYAQICVLARVPFETLRAFSFLPLLVAGFLLWKSSRRERGIELQGPEASPVPRRGSHAAVLHFGVPITIAVLYAITRSDWLFWTLATCYLTYEAWFLQREQFALPVDEPPDSRLEIVILIALCALAALLTSGANWPNSDDGYYLSLANSVLEFPQAAPQTLDTLFRSGFPPVEQALHIPETYEILVGLLSSVSGLSVKTLYYVILPPLWAVLGVLVNWLALRHFLRPREAIWGTMVFVLLLVFWGDGDKTFGNFGFVRLFQGKAIYLTVVLPLIVLAAVRYRERPNLANWLMLALGQCAAAGLTTNAIVVAPFAAALALVAKPRFDRRFLRMMLVGLAASLPLIFVALGMYLRVAPYSAALDVDEMFLGYSTTLGTARAPLVLLALTLLPALADRARLKTAGWIAGYIWIVVLVVFMPTVSSLAGRLLAHVYSWRLFWAVPLPLLLSLAAAIAIRLIGPRRWLAAVALAIWVGAFALVGPATLSGDRFSLTNLGQFKVEAGPYAAAEATVALARPDTLALVPGGVAVYVTGFPHAPPLVGVKYLRKLEGFIPVEDMALRTALFDYVSDRSPAMSASEALRKIDAARISTVVFSKRHRDARELMRRLGERGFVIHTTDRFVIAALVR